jgi:hypothetical protein
LVGSSATTPSAERRKSLLTVWQRLFPVLLDLAVDHEPTTRLLFQKLLKQLIHWFSGGGSGGGGGDGSSGGSGRGEEATLLLAALGDGIASEENSAVSSCLYLLVRASLS